ncbi:recombinase family protein [Nocardioides sp. KR10-350]|uniref:recombinase family protein n=1 Tax=Nocardioides cheoyonin TaxID=3156615 RepID=UPI0032B56553
MTITATKPAASRGAAAPRNPAARSYADLVFGGYARISEDPDDERLGVTRQVEDIEDAILRLGAIPPDRADVNRMRVENDTGAFKKRRVTITDQYGETRDAYRVIRPKWGAALRDLRAGRINALMVYDLDRLARDPYDLEDAIEAVEYYGAVIISATASEIDLMTESGRLTARFMVNIANKSSADTSRRVKRAHLARARSGAVNHGGRPFGWMPDKTTKNAREAALIEKAAADVISGIGLRAIVREWNEQGVRTARGNEWDHRALRQMLRGPRLAGWRVHQGRVATDSGGEPVHGVWEPILDQDTYDRLQLALSSRTPGRGGRRGARKYLLSGVARCGVCGSRMYAGPTPTGHAYVCRNSGPGVKGEHVNSIAGIPTDAAILDLAIKRVTAERLKAPRPAAEFEHEGRLREIPGKIAELMDAYNASQLSGAVVFPQVAALEAERDELKAARSRFLIATSTPRARDMDPEALRAGDTDAQRAALERVVEAVVVGRAAYRGARFTPDRLEVVWRDDDAGAEDEAVTR